MKRILPILVVLCALFVSCSEEEVSMFGSLSGLVKNSESGKPISGARVTLTPGGVSVLTGSDGTFSFTNLDPADYTVAFSAEDYEPAQQRVSVKPGVDASVQVVLIPVKPVLEVSSHVLEFGKDNTTLSVDISNSGKGSLEWQVSEDISWLSAVPTSGKITSEKASVVFTVSRDGLENGSHSKSLVITSNGGSETLVATLEVDVLNLSVTPAELDFGTVESTLQLTLKNTGTGSIRYSVKTENSWCAPNKTSGTVTDTDYLNVVVSRGDLAAGKYNSTVYISTNGGELTIPVKMEVVERQMPVVTLESVENITYNSATANGTLLSVGSDAVTRYGICYGTSDSPTVSDKVLSLGDTKKAQTFQSTITGLQSETTYYVRAFAENAVGLAYSERIVRFTTTGLPTVPTVESGSVDEITSTTARAKGVLVSLGNVDKVTAYGHVWGLTPSPTVTENAGKTDRGETLNTVSYESAITSLSVNTTYYVRAYATNSKGTAYGEQVSFTTAKGDVLLTTADAREIIHNAATVGGTITSDGGNTIAEAGVCYGGSSTLGIDGSHIVAELDGKTFHGRLTDLSTEINYYIRAYVKTDGGKVFYGSVKQFTTTKEVKLPTLSNPVVMDMSTTWAQISASVTSNGNASLEDTGVCISTASQPTIFDLRYSAGGSASINLQATGLTKDTEYYVRAYAINPLGVGYSEAVVFRTPATDPAVWDGVSVADMFAGGSGLADDPVRITTAAQLKLLADRVNSGQTCSGIYFRLEKDLDLNGFKWVPVGNTGGTPFMGRFNGNGHTISGLNVQSGNNDGGLFGYVSEGLLTDITVYGEVTSNQYAGGICGNASMTEINHCISYVTVNSMSASGGIVGYYYNLDSSTSFIRNNINFGAVSSDTSAGGLVGYLYAYSNTSSNGGSVNVQNNCNAGLVSGGQYSGGICGTVYSNGCNQSGPWSRYANAYFYFPKINFYANCSAGGFQGAGEKGGIFGLVKFEQPFAYYDWSDYYPEENFITLHDAFFVFDVVYNWGCERETGSLISLNDRDVKGTVNATKTEKYTRSATSCTSGSYGDVVSQLNTWVRVQDNSSDFYKWEYTTVDSFAVPVPRVKQ